MYSNKYILFHEFDCEIYVYIFNLFFIVQDNVRIYLFIYPF